MFAYEIWRQVWHIYEDVGSDLSLQLVGGIVVIVRLFGMSKMLAGNQSSLSLNLVNGRRVKDLVDVIETGYPVIGELILKKKILVSVNQEIAHEDTTIDDGDEVALLPPFAGGCLTEC